MERLFSQNYPTLLLAQSPAWIGVGGLFLLFSLCFLGVHLTKIAINGWCLYDEKPREAPPEQVPERKTEPPQSPAPIYYIVEKKRRRSKTSYGEPKEIRFK